VRRYIRVKIVCDHKLTNEQFHEILDNASRRYFGQLGVSRIDPRIVRFDAESLEAIVSCESSAAHEFESALSLITSYAEAPISLLVLRVSGTVKGAARGRK